MLPGCCRKLSRAARARSLSFSCSEKYSLTASSLRSPSSPSPPLRHITLAVAVDQRSGVLSRAPYLKFYRLALPPVKVSHGSASRLQRLFARKFSSVSKHERARSSQTVVVVESPAKAKTLQGFLGPDFLVLPCHVPVRILAAGICSVRAEDDYSLLWEVPQAAQPHVARIQNACRSAEELVLATNPDREGEALAWHVTQLVAGELSQKKRFNFQRLVCNQFTKRSVLFAMQALQRVRLPLVDAHLANCALDHLNGFSLSPLLWIKLSGSPSVGRLHLAALQLVCEREKAVKEFVPQGYWRVEAYTSVEDDIVPILLTPILTDGGLFDMNKCSVLADKLTKSTLKVFKISRKLKQRHSPEPYTTATLLEDSQDMLGFEAELTMSLAQKLYEGVDLGNGEVQGLITYPFTDEAKLSKEAVRDIQRVVGERFGNEYIRSAARSCGSDLGTTLEPHEAIRPTDMWKFPSALSQTLCENVLALYTLIWKRSIECQMEHAINEEVCVEFVTEAEAIRLQATFSHLAFNGFFAASMGEGNLSELKGSFRSMLPNNQEFVGENYNRISSLKEGAVLFVEKAHAQQHFTSGPARYSEGQLVNAMAEAGLGRPLSFASILKLLKAKAFVRVENEKIIPEVKGLLVMTFFSCFVSKFVDRNFTTLLGKQVNEVSDGRLQWKKVLREFWPAFNSEVSAVMKVPNEKIADVLHEVFFKRHFADLGLKGMFCPRCKGGKMFFKEKRFERGYEVICDRHPVCSFKAGVIGNKSASNSEGIFKTIHAKTGDIVLGVDPTTNLELILKVGPWGRYIQRGDGETGLESFRIPHGTELGDITLESALALMKYPVELGKHPKDGYAVILGLSKSSLFRIKHRNSVVPLSKNENLDQMTLKRALELLEGRKNICGQ